MVPPEGQGVASVDAQDRGEEEEQVQAAQAHEGEASAARQLGGGPAQPRGEVGVVLACPSGRSGGRGGRPVLADSCSCCC